jgi:hypothetical protein
MRILPGTCCCYVNYCYSNAITPRTGRAVIFTNITIYASNLIPCCEAIKCVWIDSYEGRERNMRVLRPSHHVTLN